MAKTSLDTAPMHHVPLTVNFPHCSTLSRKAPTTLLRNYLIHGLPL